MCSVSCIQVKMKEVCKVEVVSLSLSLSLSLSFSLSLSHESALEVQVLLRAIQSKPCSQRSVALWRTPAVCARAYGNGKKYVMPQSKWLNHCMARNSQLHNNVGNVSAFECPGLNGLLGFAPAAARV